MALQIRRGNDTQRQSTRFVSGELVFVTDFEQAGVSPLFVGNGNNGGLPVAPVRSVNGLTGNVVLNTDLIDEGDAKYYDAAQARADAGAALVAGNTSSSGITFSYSAGTNSISAVVSAGGYDLPNAGPTVLGGVKINAGGLTIDGAGLLSVTTPVASGVAGHLTYYTGTNAVGDSGTGLTWATSNFPIAGGLLVVDGTVESSRIVLDKDLAHNSLTIQTESGGDGTQDPLVIKTYHNDALASSAFFSRAKGTYASPAPLASGDAIFSLGFSGRTTSGSNSIAAIMQGEVAGTVGAGILPGKITFTIADLTGALQRALTVTSSGISVTGDLTYSGLRISPANFITVSTSTTYALSTTKHKNILLVTTGALTATLTMPPAPVDGQLCIISVHTNDVTLALTSSLASISGAFTGSVTAPTTFEYIYRASNTTWYRIQ